MFPVYLFNNREEGNIGINAQDFAERFLSLCDQHRIQNRARIFAFILTDHTTLDANRFILDNGIWNGLHTLSAHYLTIFHLDFQSDDINQLFRRGETQFVRDQYDNFFINLSRTFGFENNELANTKMPAILFFQTESSQIIDFFVVELHSNNPENEIKNLQNYIREGVEAVSGVTEENLGNSREIYNLLKTSVLGAQTIKAWTIGIRKFIELKNLFY